MTRPDDEFPPLDVTSTLNLAALEDMIESNTVAETDVAPGRVAGSLPPGTALLVVRRGPNAGARFLLDHDVTTSGRHPDSDIFLDDVTVSRRHAEFHRDGATFTVRDVGSLNGTYVNRERVEAATLASGDEVQIGKFRLVLISGPRPDEQ
jgi:pSer/pThr/pTyr-binding forkhead associated (FHA) protein